MPASTIVAVLVCLASLAPAAAQDDPPDRLVLQPEGRTSRLILRGRIVDYTGRSITIIAGPSNEERVFPASQVVEVETPQTEPHVRGLAHFGRGDIDQAKRSFEAALNAESRTWVRREILALLVRCALRQGDYGTAGVRFLLLAKSDPETRHFRLAPLVWGPREVDAGLKSQARAWLTQPEDPARLLGASLLLDDPQYGGEAEATLRQLASNVNPKVQRLAQTQLWRKRLQSGNIGRGELARWQERIEALPDELRGGPWYLLGRGHLLQRDYEPAAAALLWLPLVYDHDHHLAARACLEAADALARLGQTTEAATLYREVEVRFQDTPYAQEAAALLEPPKQDR